MRLLVTNWMKGSRGLGLILTALLVIAVISLSSAQNLGLGTGSGLNKSPDSTEIITPSSNSPESGPRKAQMGKRLGLLNRKSIPLDPKVFEARGRELQGQFYEIGGVAKPQALASTHNLNTAIYSSKPKDHSRAWIYWTSAAGVAGVSAGVASIILLKNAHSPSKPQYIDLSDTP